jgi:tyrosinase
MAMNGAFTIFYIIGEVTGASASGWVGLPGFVGLNHVFAAPREACDNCGRQEEQATKVTDTSPITSLLLDYVISGGLESMEARHVRPFLVRNLKWRVQTVGGDRSAATISDRAAGRRGRHQPARAGPRPLVRPVRQLQDVAPPGPGRTVEYEFYPDVIADIIANSS